MLVAGTLLFPSELALELYRSLAAPISMSLGRNYSRNQTMVFMLRLASAAVILAAGIVCTRLIEEDSPALNSARRRLAEKIRSTVKDWILDELGERISPTLRVVSDNR